MDNHEQKPESIITEPSTLLDRLIREETQRAAAHAALDQLDELSFGFKADSAKGSAYFNNPNLVKEIRLAVIIPDDILSDAAKNQINLSAFVRRYLDPSEWKDYIQIDD